MITRNNSQLSPDNYREPNYELPDFPQHIEKSILIQASPQELWKHLTTPALMKIWMGDAEMNIEVLSDLKPGSPITIRGFHHVQFENKGTILQLEPYTLFQYEYLSSMSHLENITENYTTVTFRLVQKERATELTVEAENFPTVEIYKHLEFYWNGTLQIIQLQIESNEAPK